MELSIPYNGDLRLLTMIKESGVFPIRTVYGKAMQDVIGGGRARYDICNYGEDNLTQAIKLTHQLGAKFNYLFNAPCSANAEIEKESKIVSAVEKLISEFQIDCVTVASPTLLRILKSRFPRLLISISIIARVDSLEKVRCYEDEGADEITLDYNIYRNFRELERIRQNSSIGYQLIVNDGFLFNCPWAMYHFQMEGHDSQAGFNNDLKYFSFCRFNCKQRVAKDSGELIKGMWIRPEDLHFYEDIGYSKFKIIDRLKETSWLMNAIGAYAQRLYNGNLSDIICSFDTFEKETTITPPLTRAAIGPNTIQHLKPYWDLKPIINNQKLGRLKFLEFFRLNEIDCRNMLCRDCRYCEDIARKAVTIDRKNANCVAQNLDLLKNEMIELLKTA